MVALRATNLLFIEYIALIVLRKKAPTEHRPFKIPLGIPGLCLMMLLPLSVYIFAVGAAFIDEGKTLLPIVFALITLISAELFWQMIQLRRRLVARKATIS